MKEFKNKDLEINIYLKEWHNEFLVTDSDFWQIKKSFEDESGALEYIENLLSCKNKSEYNFYKWCVEKELREGTIIQFEDGKQGVILGKEFVEGCLKYSPLKKDGTTGKAKRNLYGNTIYKVIKY